jgi:hypothetical protein
VSNKNIKAWMYQFPMSDGKWGLSFEKPLFTEGVPLVHEREWVGLTEEEIEYLFEKFDLVDAYFRALVKDIEEKLKEKNT